MARCQELSSAQRKKNAAGAMVSRVEHLHDEVTRKEVGQVGPPTCAEDLLFLPQWIEALDGHEYQREKEQVQQEEVQADVARRLDRSADLDAGAAGERGQQGEADSDGAECLVAPQDKTGDAQGKRGDQAHVNQAADQAHGIDGAQLGRGENVRKMQAEHGREAHDAQRGGDYAADPTGAETRFAFDHVSCGLRVQPAPVSRKLQAQPAPDALRVAGTRNQVSRRRSAANAPQASARELVHPVVTQ